jgi:hypothetical protein
MLHTKLQLQCVHDGPPLGKNAKSTNKQQQQLHYSHCILQGIADKNQEGVLKLHISANTQGINEATINKTHEQGNTYKCNTTVMIPMVQQRSNKVKYSSKLPTSSSPLIKLTNVQGVQCLSPQ